MPCFVDLIRKLQEDEELGMCCRKAHCFSLSIWGIRFFTPFLVGQFDAVAYARVSMRVLVLNSNSLTTDDIIEIWAATQNHVINYQPSTYPLFDESETFVSSVHGIMVIMPPLLTEENWSRCACIHLILIPPSPTSSIEYQAERLPLLDLGIMIRLMG